MRFGKSLVIGLMFISSLARASGPIDYGNRTVKGTFTVTGTSALTTITGTNLTFGTASNTVRLLLPSNSTSNLSGLTNTAGLLGYDTTLQKPVYNNGAAWVTVGSGSSGTNYSTNPDAEADTSTWTTYADAAGSVLVDGTGGSPASTWTRSTSSPISGVANFLWTKSANNRQGEGVCEAITVDEAGKSKVFSISFDYEVGSGTFVGGTSSTDSDIVVGVYDVTNSVFIQPSTYRLFSSATSPPAQFSGYFQTSATGTSYRVCLHTAATSASAFTLKVDNFNVSRATYAYGTPITDWAAYTPTLVGFGTVSAVNMQWRRVGANIEISGTFTMGSNSGSTATISLPSGLTSASGLPSSAVVGSMVLNGNLAGSFYILGSASASTLNFSYSDSTHAGATARVGTDYSNSQVVSLRATIPISGWSSSVQMSDSSDSRVVAASYYMTSDTSQTLNTSVNYPTKLIDTHAAVTTGAGAWTFKVPVAGVYLVTHTTDSTSGLPDMYLSKNGTNVQYFGTISVINQVFSGSTMVNCAAGDTLAVMPSATFTAKGLVSSVPTTAITIQRISGPTAIGATETIAARYGNTAGTSIANSGETTVPFATKDYDTHGAFVTDTFTAPAPGKYRATCNLNYASATYAASNSAYAVLYKTSVATAFSPVSLIGGTPTGSFGAVVTTVLNLVAGDTVLCKGLNTRTAGATTLNTTAGTNFFEIIRIGL